MARYPVIAVPLLLIATASAFVLSPPKPTPTTYDVLDGNGWTPKPTKGPSYPRFAGMQARDLFGWQDGGAPVCGYVEGDIDAPFSCFTGGGCGYYKNPNYFVCCETDSSGSFVSSDGSCASATACVGYNVNDLDSDVTDAVTASNNVLCPSNMPLCGTVYLFGEAGENTIRDPNTYSYYSCGATSTVIYIYGEPIVYTDNTTTYTYSSTDIAPITTEAAQTETVTDTYTPPTSSATVIITVTPPVGSSGAYTSTLPPVTVSTGTASLQSVTAGSSSGSSLSPSTASPTPSASPTASPVPPPDHSSAGAIAGGVIGGVAIIALIAGSIWFLARRKQKVRESAVPEISQFGNTPKQN